MINIVKKKTGQDIVSWRGHGLVHDSDTYNLLAEFGIKMISDEISSSKLFPEKTKEGLISHPMNVIMDHDHVYHAHRTKEYVEKAKQRGYGYAGDFISDSYTIEEWGEMVEKQVIDIEKKNGIATILMHPICQFLSDEFKTARKLLKLFSQYKTIWAKEIIL